MNIRKQASLGIMVAACLALFAAPALAADAGGMNGMNMNGGKMAAHHAMHHRVAKRHAHAMRTRLSCNDYAWQSRDQKDCEAGKIKPPRWR